MATNYPSSTDVFNVPVSPSTTPLSSAGTGSRNHVSHHRDLGDAVMALQDNAAQITHIHDGTGLNAPKLLQVNTHESPDTDAAANSLHHTIGTSATQAAAGNHTHDVRYIRLDGAIAQTVTGKKTFPSGTTAVAIPDFQNSQHSHISAATGGMAAVVGDMDDNRYYNFPGTTIAMPATKDFYVHANRFTIPANMGMAGYIYISFNYSAITSNDIFFQASWNNSGGTIFNAAKSVIAVGETYGGTRAMSFNIRNTGGTQRALIMIPIWLAPSASARASMAIGLRVVSAGSVDLGDFNTAFHAYFTAPLITL